METLVDLWFESTGRTPEVWAGADGGLLEPPEEEQFKKILRKPLNKQMMMG